MEFQKIKRFSAWFWLVCMGYAPIAFPLKLPRDCTIDDVEISDFLETIARPVVEKTPALRRLKFYTLFNREFNAFAVEHGSFVHPALLDHPCIFVHTGIIEQETLGTLVLVLFHELGHIVGKHTTHTQTAISDNAGNTLAPAALGCLVAGLTGGLLPLFYGLHMSSVKSLLSKLRYTRGHESAADAFAFKQLAALKWPVADGVNMMLRHAKKEVFQPNAHYLRSHPFFADRAKASEDYFKKERSGDYAFPEKLIQDFDKIKIKILAFSGDLHKISALIEKAPVSENVRNYGRAIAAYRQGKTDQALQLLTRFEQENGGPSAYTCQLRSEILQAHGRHALALAAINQALKFYPHNFSFLLQKTAILLCLPQRFQEVIRILEPMIATHGHEEPLWIFLGRAYAGAGNTGRMHICLAEQHALMQKWSRAEHHIRLGQKLLPPNDFYRQRSHDLFLHIKELKK